jgi:cell division transport system permease protein
MHNLFRVLKISAINFIRNSWVNITAILIMFLVAVSTTLFVVVGMNLNQTISDIESKADVSIYLRDGSSPDEITRLQNLLQQQPAVKQDGIRFISKEEALTIFSGRNTGIEVAPNDNPLPASFEVKSNDPAQLSAIVEAVKDNTAIEKNGIKFNKEAIEKIMYWAQVLRTLGLTLISFLACISFLVILNTIKLALYTRKEEIEIMKLVGATDWFIRWPFIFESALSGFVASSLSVLVFLLGSSLLNSQLAVLFRITPVFFSWEFLLQVCVGQIVAGTLFGAFSSFVGTKGFLRV